MLALGQKSLEPRFRLRGRIGACDAEDIEALLACRADESVLDGGGLFRGGFGA
jgi:hypothetical protein